MLINEAVKETRQALDAHGLWEWKVKLDNAKSRAGQCDYARKTISLSRPLILLRETAATRNTILHEVAHALTPDHGHDAVWKAKFRAIGGNGQRCSEGRTLSFRYVGTCSTCGRKSGRHRMTKAIRRGSSCGKCTPGNKYDARYRLVWVDTHNRNAYI